jgi:hypothetical protein
VLQNKSIKIILKSIVGLSLFLWMSYSLYSQIKLQPNLKGTLHEIFFFWDTSKLLVLLIIILLMIVNWTIEAAKWRVLLAGTEYMTLWSSLQSVLTGVAVSMITPNRIGEYVGRILYMKNVNKIKGITVTIVGSFAQLIVTGLLGLLGLIYYIYYVEHSSWLNVLLVSSVVLCVGLGYIYFHLDKLVKWVEQYPYLRKIKIYLDVLKRFDITQLLYILLLSFFRYMIYSIQFALLLYLLKVEIPIVPLFFTIWLVYWAMAIVPTVAIAELSIRGETALYFFVPLTDNHLGVVSATLILWLINLILPALIGCLFVFKMKLYRDE